MSDEWMEKYDEVDGLEWEKLMRSGGEVFLFSFKSHLSLHSAWQLLH